MDSLNQLLNPLMEIWDKQSKQIKYVIIAVASIPSFICLREMYWFIHRKSNSLPPGPNGYPLIGIARLWHSGTMDRINLAEKYGPIIYTSYLGYPHIILSSSALVKKINTQKQFLDRNLEDFYKPENLYQPSIFTVGKSQAIPLASVDGDSWSKRRKYTQQTLFKTLSNKNVSNLLKETFEADVKPYFHDIITSNNGKWNRTKDIFEYVTLSTIYMAIFGERLDRNSNLYQTVKKNINNIMQAAVLDTIVVSMPFLKYFYGEQLLKLRASNDEILLKLVTDRASTKNNDEEKSYIDYMQEMVVNGELTQDEVLADLLVLFIAGMDTTSNTLQYSVTLLAKYPDIQDKIRKELSDVMGKEYDIALVNKCPLFRAAVHEIMRISSIAFMGVERGSKKDYWLTMDDGTKYKIPKNCTIMTNTDYIHIFGGKNGKGENWKRVNKDEIILENFLVEDESNGTVRFVKNESFIPFGVGKRDCVGRQLAMKELQYALGYLLFNYKFTLSNKKDADKDVTLWREALSQTANLKAGIPINIEKI